MNRLKGPIAALGFAALLAIALACAQQPESKLASGVKLLAHALEVPIYPLAEHLLQLGAREVFRELEDPERKKRLQEHLLQGRLLVPALTGEEDKTGLYGQETLKTAP